MVSGAEAIRWHLQRAVRWLLANIPDREIYIYPNEHTHTHIRERHKRERERELPAANANDPGG